VNRFVLSWNIWYCKTDKTNLFYRIVTWCQFHQHFTSAFLYESALQSFSLVTFWQKKHFRAKNALIKRWWKWHQEAILLYQWFSTFWASSPCKKASKSRYRDASRRLRNAVLFYTFTRFPILDVIIKHFQVRDDKNILPPFRKKVPLD